MAAEPTTPPDAGEPRSRFPLLPLGVFAAMTLCIALGGWQYQEHLQTLSRRSATEALEAIADLKVWRISTWRAERMGDAHILAANIANADRLRAFLENPSPNDTGEDILRFMRVFIESGGYRGMVLTTADGEARLSVGPDPARLGGHARAMVLNVTQTGRGMLSDFHRVSNVDIVHLDLCAPILVPAEGGERCVGAFLLRIDPDRFLYPTIQNWPTPSPTAETLLVRREGESVLFLNELRHRGNTAMDLRFPLDQLTLPAVAAARGFTGVMEGIDYRGVRVVAATRPVPDTPWSLVAKIDEAEVYGPILRQARIMGGVVAGLVLMAGLLVALWWREREAALLRRRLAAEAERRALQERYLAERAAAEATLRASLHEKTTLLQELHHRVKNNMQIVSSMLHMQAASVKDPAAVAALGETQNRISAMALLHETLYRSENISHVDFPAYVKDVCAHLFRAFGASAARIQLTVDVRRSTLSLDQAIPCGLIVNELVSNSLKHAFPGGRAGEVRVEFTTEEDGRGTLAVSDNGVGMPPETDTARAATLGLRLVHGLAGQIKGTVEWRRERGVACRILFRAQS
jgi:two-component sensor histidine kinase